MCEPLLLANPDTNTLRPARSRASTIAKQPARTHAYFLPHLLMCWLGPLSGDSRRSRSRHQAVLLLHFLVGIAWSARLFSLVAALRIFGTLFLGGLATWFVIRTNLVDGSRG
jgi:hypothetical protein